MMVHLYEVWDTIDLWSDNAKKNNMAIALIFQSVPEALTLQIGEHDTSKKIWEAIKSPNLGVDRVREARLQILMSEFDKLKMAYTDTLDDYAGKLSDLASRAAALGEITEESKMVKKFLKGLLRTKFINIVALLKQVLDLNSTGFEDIVGRLKTFEEHIKEKTQDEDQSKLMFVKNDTQGHGSHNNSRGRGIVEVMVEEEEDEEGLMVLMVIIKEEKLRTRPRRTTLRLNAGDATRWGTLCHIVLHNREKEQI
ncbi:PREDICTED: uncharacterized protein LOC106302476 [Brassica oleracea var. oleracea]|uniref:uncharacterized protein LOC106302476 n=1 Tax=Brassica oleracea var. oleracea TaxID=109376 RepID=UPI0006A6F9F8|nr:PREDICTED: uncharacterized protein LOC106302476 [Brassica oleracea var. oleracea]